MGGLDEAGPQRQRGARELLNAEVAQPQAYADDVHDGVHCTHLVEVNLLDARSVYLCFGFREPPEHGNHVRFDLWGKAGVGDDRPDVGEVSVRLLRFFEHDLRPRPGDAVLRGGLSFESPPADGEAA